MCSLSFVDRIELEFSGNHFSHALCLEDVDNDGVSILMFSYSKMPFNTYSPLTHLCKKIMINQAMVMLSVCPW